MTVGKVVNAAIVLVLVGIPLYVQFDRRDWQKQMVEQATEGAPSLQEIAGPGSPECRLHDEVNVSGSHGETVWYTEDRSDFFHARSVHLRDGIFVEVWAEGARQQFRQYRFDCWGNLRSFALVKPQEGKAIVANQFVATSYMGVAVGKLSYLAHGARDWKVVKSDFTFLYRPFHMDDYEEGRRLLKRLR